MYSPDEYIMIYFVRRNTVISRNDAFVSVLRSPVFRYLQNPMRNEMKMDPIKHPKYSQLSKNAQQAGIVSFPQISICQNRHHSQTLTRIVSNLPAYNISPMLCIITQYFFYFSLPFRIRTFFFCKQSLKRLHMIMQGTRSNGMKCLADGLDTTLVSTE